MTLIKQIDENKKCNENCKYYEKRFEHLNSACVLSSAFSKPKGSECEYYKNK